MDILFYLKKIVTFFIEPLGFTITFGLVGLYLLHRGKYRVSKLFLTISIGSLLLFSYPPFANLLVTNLEDRYHKYEYTKDIRYIHVLGAGHTTDPSQPLSSQICSAGLKRDIEGIHIYNRSKNSKIIFTGYEGFTDTPASTMNSKLAISLGVKAEDIIQNPKPKDTKEEAIFAKSIVGEEPFALVTSATHMPRAMMIFQSLGMHPVAAPTDFVKSKGYNLLAAPNIDALNRSKRAIHEYMGIAWRNLTN
ncbi:Membrane Protein Functionally coupled to the MukBEF Chromosome Partitioning Mechanism [hydrothermal vent metagenome]|uniref:Membrane Protein Functionally coupled to the MukBEF Chromosome Partitioning Mechanism n=1 Tax=hydrothermal vent metagenome TaxID=652676 RepID=A0A1W1BJ42_9ZZZZ